MNKDKQELLTSFGRYFQELAQTIEDIKEELAEMKKDADFKENYK